MHCFPLGSRQAEASSNDFLPAQQMPAFSLTRADRYPPHSCPPICPPHSSSSYVVSFLGDRGGGGVGDGGKGKRKAYLIFLAILV